MRAPPDDLSDVFVFYPTHTVERFIERFAPEMGRDRALRALCAIGRRSRKWRESYTVGHAAYLGEHRHDTGDREAVVLVVKWDTNDRGWVAPTVLTIREANGNGGLRKDDLLTPPNNPSR